MLETLTNLKNNKAKKAGNAGQTGGMEAVERMNKFLSGLTKKRHGERLPSFLLHVPTKLSPPLTVLAHEPLRMSLVDLRAADTKGKWWLVGAGWGGDPLVDRQVGGGKSVEKPTPETLAENALLRLAKKQGMNTDVRRSVFVVLMSSDARSFHVMSS
jgi:nucleolar MIF4G domain-containing protein 1